MALSGSIEELGRVRLSNRTERVVQTTGLGISGGFLFGFVFVAFGTVITLIGWKIIPVAPSGVHAPYWILSLFGGIFGASGMIVWAMALQEWLQVKRRQALAARHPRSEVFADYPWNPKGITKSPWSLVGKSLCAILLGAEFLTPFNWWAWGATDSSLMIKIIVSLFDLGLAFGVIELVRQILVALKYGNSRVEYETFPCHTGGRVGLRWFAPSGIENTTSVTFVLRCVEEWLESTGTGEDRSSCLIHEQLWAASRGTESRVDIRPNRPLSLAFDVPGAASGSNLSGKLRIIFWELDVCAEAPGVDFQECYLVPVYAKALLCAGPS